MYATLIKGSSEDGSNGSISKYSRVFKLVESESALQRQPGLIEPDSLVYLKHLLQPILGRSKWFSFQVQLATISTGCVVMLQKREC